MFSDQTMKWCNCYGKQYGSSTEKLNIELTWASNSTSRHKLNNMESTGSSSCLCTPVLALSVNSIISEWYYTGWHLFVEVWHCGTSCSPEEVWRHYAKAWKMDIAWFHRRDYSKQMGGGVKFIETESGEWIPGHEGREDGYRVRIWVVEDILEMVMVHNNLSVVSSINCLRWLGW